MGVLNRAKTRKQFGFLGGGWVSRPTDGHIDALSQGKLLGKTVKNVDYFAVGGIRRPQGMEQLGTRMNGGSAFASSTPSSNSNSSNLSLSSTDTTQAICLKITAGSSKSVAKATIKFAVDNIGAGNSVLARVALFSDSAGSPNTRLGTSNTLTINTVYFNSARLNGTIVTEFIFATPVALTSATDYWLCLEFVGDNASGTTASMRWAMGSSGSPTIKMTTNNYSTVFSVVGGFDLYYILTASVPPVNGLWDTRFQDGNGGISQYYCGQNDGKLWAAVPSRVEAGNSWGSYSDLFTADGTAIYGTFGSATDQNAICDMTMLMNRAIFADHASHIPRVWDGIYGKGRSPAATYGSPTDLQSTMQLGLQPTVTASTSSPTGGASTWTNTGTVRILHATTLKSGGIRAKIYDLVISATNQDAVVVCAHSENYAEMYFEVDATATTAYMTKPGGDIFYKIDTARTTGMSSNPMANSETGYTIYATGDAVIEGWTTLEADTGLPVEYFTLQVATPKLKYLGNFYDSVIGAGDPENPSRLWITEQYTVHIFSEYGRTKGSYIDISVDDGEYIIGFEKSDDGSLIVSKQHKCYKVSFTGDINDPYSVKAISGQTGALSHWSMVQIPEGVFYLSERGPQVVVGTESHPLAQTAGILDMFEFGSSTGFNISSLFYSTAVNDTARNTLFVTVASNGSTLRDQILCYDYEAGAFHLRDGYNANFLANLAQTNGFPLLSYGTNDGVVVRKSSSVYTNNGNVVSLNVITPEWDMGDPTSTKEIHWLWLGGKVSTGTVYVDIYVDGATYPNKTLTFDTSSSEWNLGIKKPVGVVCRTIKIGLRQDDSTSELQIDYMGIDYDDNGVR